MIGNLLSKLDGIQALTLMVFVLAVSYYTVKNTLLAISEVLVAKYTGKDPEDEQP